jgi:hypothetical protein
MRRRRVGLALIFGAAVPLVIASTAWACGLLATLKVDTKQAAPGASVKVTGVNYSDAANASDVSIRLNSRSGPVLGTTKPAAGSNSIDKTVQLPSNAKPGYHVLLATQSNVQSGTPRAGTPGRTTIRVQGAARRRSEAPFAPLSSSKPTSPGGATAPASAGGLADPSVPTLLGIVLSLTLLGTGVTLVARSRTRAANRPLLGA